MAQDFAKKRRPAAKTKRSSASKKPSRRTAQTKSSPAGGWRWYSAGVLTGVFLSFLVYLGTLPQGGDQLALDRGPAGAAVARTAAQPPKPRFDFYKMLPKQTIDVEPEPAAPPGSTKSTPPESTRQYYVLQAGSFRQLDDAERRRAELLFLGLEPTVEETIDDKGRLYRVKIGPFESRSKMSKARSLTAGQNIDTLLLKRSKAG